MKKLFMCVMTIMMLFVFTACGGDESTTTTAENTSITNTTIVAEKTTAAEATSAASKETTAVDEKTVVEVTTNVQEQTTVLIEENNNGYNLIDEVIVDDENISFTVTSIDADGLWGFTINALLENKSDKDLMFSWDKVSVNGYMIDPFWAKEVAAGKKANVEISFSNDDLEECNISIIDVIEFNLAVSDADDWLADRFIDNIYSVYPTGKTEDTITYAERVATEGEQVIVNDDNCTFIIVQELTDSFWGYTLQCYLENKTEKTLMFSWEDVSVNGFMMDPFWATEIAAGKKSYTEISFLSSDFDNNKIKAVENIEFTLDVYDSDDWMADKIIEETFTYAP